LIVGLGNPGAEYERTRHNAGYLVLDRLAARWASGQTPRGQFHAATLDARIARPGGEARALLMKPTTYMNRSGVSVAEAVRFYKVSPASDVLVIVDDTALPLGKLRLRSSGGAGGHNGLADIETRLGTTEYARLRVGVGEPGRAPKRDYVLGRFSSEQWPDVAPALDRAADAAETWATEGAIAAMNAFNVDPKRAPAGGQSATEGNSKTNDGASPGTGEASAGKQEEDD